MTSLNPPKPKIFQRILVFTGCLLFCLQTLSAQDNLRLQVTNGTLTEVLQQLEDQTDYRFAYNQDRIDPNTNVTLNGTFPSIRAVLDRLSALVPLTYRIQEDQVILLAASESTQEKAERLIRGKVVFASDQAPMPGATVLIKGTSRGALTNEDGEFIYLLQTADIPNTILEVKYLGMRTLTQRVGNASYFNFEMEEEANELSQVVLTSSYGTKKLREEVVGSISTLESKDLPLEQAAESIDKILDGQVAGVLIENTTGVGGPVRIDIRGQGTLTPLGNQNLGTSPQPLIIIDGVIMTEEIAIDNLFFDGAGSFAESLNNPLGQLAPEDIESINILKDAAAVSIYGADGANGVILITTKKGRRGNTRFGFSTQIGISEAINQIEYLSGSQYQELRNNFLTNTGNNPVPYNGVDTNWFDLMNRAGTFNRYNFNASGATDKVSYRASATYLDIGEPQVGNEAEQLNLSFQVGYRTDKFSLDFSMIPSYITRKTPNIYYNFAFLPTLDPFEEDGSFALLGVNGQANPLAAAEQNRSVSRTYGLLASINLNYDLTPHIKLSTLFGTDYKDKNQDRYFSAENESGRFNGTFELDGETYPNWGRRILNYRTSNRWNWQTQAQYNNDWGLHHLDLLGGLELSEEKTDFSYASGRGFTNPFIVNPVENALQDDDPNTPENDAFDNQSFQADINYNSRVSFYSQLNYDFRDTYFFLANFRRDESSVFGRDTNVAYNGGVGLGWTLSNETFLSGATWLDFLKLRGSYGTTGNSRIGSYRSKGLYTTGQNGYNGLPEAQPSAAPNPQLSWEKNNKFNLGMDFRLFNRVSLTVEYYRDKIEDLITSRDIPSENGYNTLQLNAATMINKGLEISTRIDWFKTPGFDWTTNFNLSTLDNEVTELVGLGSDFSIAANALAQRVGFSTSTIWGVQWAGIDPATGRDLVQYQDQIYDAATYRSLFDESNWVPLGDRQPDVYGGFNNTFRLFKDITLAIRGSYQIGGSFLASHELISQYNFTTNRNLSVNAYDFWRGPGDTAALQPVVTNTNPIIANFSKYVYDLTHLRISNINLSYNVPLENTRLPLDNLSVFVDVSNVAYWYKDKSPQGRNGVREFRFIYPQARTISCGIKTSF